MLRVALVLLDALAAELAILVALILGIAIAWFVVVVPGILLRRGRLGVMRALFQGGLAGAIAAASGIVVSVFVTRSFGLPSSWSLWIAGVPFVVGEFGDFLRRFSLAHIGKPTTIRDDGWEITLLVANLFLVPLGRLHGAAKMFQQSSIFELLSQKSLDDSAGERTQAAHEAVWYVGWLSWGIALGAAAIFSYSRAIL